MRGYVAARRDEDVQNCGCEAFVPQRSGVRSPGTADETGRPRSLFEDATWRGSTSKSQVPADDGGGLEAQYAKALDIAEKTLLPEIDVEDLLTFTDFVGDGQTKAEPWVSAFVCDQMKFTSNKHAIDALAQNKQDI